MSRFQDSCLAGTLEKSKVIITILLIHVALHALDHVWFVFFQKKERLDARTDSKLLMLTTML